MGSILLSCTVLLLDMTCTLVTSRSHIQLISYFMKEKSKTLSKFKECKEVAKVEDRLPQQRLCSLLSF